MVDILAKKSDILRRRQAALSSAARCIQVLKRRFGARRVILFGSLVGDGPWHAQSDIDLAVEGVTSEEMARAEASLEAILPPWLTLDLVSLESVYPEVRARILKETAMPPNPHLALNSRLQDELKSLARIVAGLQNALERAGATPDEFAARALASYIDDFYKGCERICERVAVTLDDGVPAGERWHQQLLNQMGEPGGHGRPPLFDASLLWELDEYRRFRHRVRHLYGYELEIERVLKLAQDISSLFIRVRQAVERLGRWLSDQANRDDPLA